MPEPEVSEDIEVNKDEQLLEVENASSSLLELELSRAVEEKDFIKVCL